MMELSKNLQEDIRINQINLKAAIQNHQVLVVKLRGGNLADPSDVKLKLAGIQKHILSLGEAQKVLVARVKKELAANNNAWSNHTSERPNAELRVYPPSANCIDPAKKFNATYQKRPNREAKSDRDEEESERKRNQDGGGGDGAPPTKRLKTILHASSRPTSPVLDTRSYDQSTLPSSSEDSQESLTIDTSSEPPSKIDFLSAVGLVSKEQLMLAKSNGSARRRRRYAGHHSQYSSHGNWDLTVRRHRPRCGDLGLVVRAAGDNEAVAPISMPITDALLGAAAAAGDDDFEEEEDDDEDMEAAEGRMMTSSMKQEPVGEGRTMTSSMKQEPVGEGRMMTSSVKQEAVSSGGSSPAPTPPPPLPPPLSSLSPHSLSPDKIVCTVCRKKGILSVCDICSTAFHWFCLDKDQKQCPVCLVSQVGDAPSFRSVPRSVGLVQAPKSEAEPFTRYYRRAPAAAVNSSHYNESNGKHKKVDCWRREDERESKENSRHN